MESQPILSKLGLDLFGDATYFFPVIGEVLLSRTESPVSGHSSRVLCQGVDLAYAPIQVCGLSHVFFIQARLLFRGNRADDAVSFKKHLASAECGSLHDHDAAWALKSLGTL